MEESSFDALIAFLADENGAEVPDVKTANKRWQAQAMMFKILYQEIKLVRGMTVKGWIQDHLVTSVGIVAMAAAFMLTLWVGLWVFFEIPAVAGWIRELLNIPLPPVG